MSVIRGELFQSQDIKLLKDEMTRGFEYLDQLAELRDQCTSLAWKKEVEALKKYSKYVKCLKTYLCVALT